MVTQFMSPNFSERSFQSLQQELLDILTQGDACCYPWNPAEPAAESYFETLENQFSLPEVWSDEELVERANSFFAMAQSVEMQSNSQSAKANLWQRFADFIPARQLDAILSQAEVMLDRNLAQINQLVACVQPLWSNWSEDDLQVFARPLAMAMRGNNTVKVAPWDELTEIEQIRLTLLVAQEAINQMANDGQ